MLNEGIKLGIILLIAIGALVGFIGLYGVAFINIRRKPDLTYTDTYIYVATALAALIGGYVAAGFNQQLPQAGVSDTVVQQASASIAAQIPLQTILIPPEGILPESTAEPQLNILTREQLNAIANNAIQNSVDQPSKKDNVTAVGTLILGRTKDQWQSLVGAAFAISYVVMGLIAVVLYVMPAKTPALVKNLAAIFLGLAITILGSFLT